MAFSNDGVCSTGLLGAILERDKLKDPREKKTRLKLGIPALDDIVCCGL